MSPIKTQPSKKLYAELLSLAQLYMLRSHQSGDKCKIDDQSFSILKPFMQKSKPVVKEIKQKPQELLSVNAIVLPVNDQIQKSSVTVLESKTVQPESKKELTPLQTSINVEEKKAALISSNVSINKKNIQLEPLIAKPSVLDSSHRDFFEKNFPNYPLSNEILSDHLAHKIKKGWMVKNEILPVIILSFNEQDQSSMFLKNICKAISLYLAPTCVLSGIQLEREQRWEELFKTPHLRLIIACDYELYMQKNLMHYYKHTTTNNSHFLNQIPLLLLSDLNFYLKRPELKSFLWNAICNILK